jgi:hypothetical protein
MLPYDKAKSANNPSSQLQIYSKMRIRAAMFITHFCMKTQPFSKNGCYVKNIGLFIYPMNPIAALPNLVRLSL